MQAFPSSWRWFELEFTLQNVRLSPHAKEIPHAVVQSIIKNVTNSFTHYPRTTITFSLGERSFVRPLSLGESLSVRVFFFRHQEPFVEEWKNALSEYFSKGKRNYRLASCGVPTLRHASELCSPSASETAPEEVCLDFITPLGFTKVRGKPRTFLDAQGFFTLLFQRFATLFGEEIPMPDTRKLEAFPYYWNFVSQQRASVSGSGTQQLKGCTGKYYIKGGLGPFLPFLQLGERLQTGGKLGYGMGRYRFYPASLPHFDEGIADVSTFRDSWKQMREEDDGLWEEFRSDKGFDMSEEEFLKELTKNIGKGDFPLHPNRAFYLKEDERLIEECHYEIQLLQKALYKLLMPVLDKSFEESSLGFRKGIPHTLIADKITQSIQEGFTHVLETDIEHFFPSISHQRLFLLLERYLPAKDLLTKKLLRGMVELPYSIEGELKERSVGLAQGSPLSPLLANLYLDDFDEAVRENESVRFFRYADDFIILTRSRDKAELQGIKVLELLREAGLSLKEEKTAIQAVSDGFRFLGHDFSSQGKLLAPSVKLLKKPLFVTEPFVFLGIRGEVLEIRSGGEIKGVFPLRRLSEIMIMERVSVSSNLVKACCERKIPLTFQLNSGYFVTTVAPDSKEFHNTGYFHQERFRSLSHHEIRLFAGEIASSKVEGYLRLFEQHYEKGANELIRQLKEVQEQMQTAETVETVRGLEGFAARLVYREMVPLIKNKAFHFKERNRKNNDPMNGLFNYASFLLFSRINAMLRTAGLNPYLGFLHSHRDDYESLTCDIQELFRARTDRFLIRVVNLGIIKEKDFEERNGRPWLLHEKRKLFLSHFERELSGSSGENEASLIEELRVQVSVLKSWARSEGNLSFYRWK